MFTAANDNGFAYRTTAFSGDNEWYTPAKYIDMAREVMGGIDVDPASNDYAQETVRATTYYTAENSGLGKDWHGRIWMNPPYSKSLIGRFCEKLASEYELGRTIEAVVLTNNSADTRWFSRLISVSSAVCFTRGRIKFESPTRRIASPAMGQVFTYIGHRPERFASVFDEIGHTFAPTNDNRGVLAA
jgi:phage N-6-adenine-methyltransferase